MKPLAFILALTWTGLWFTPDQLGQHYFRQGKFAKAAATFQDPLWKGISQFRAGAYENAVQTFARVDTAEGHYNQGNAWVLLGKYEQAVDSYDRALALRPNWIDARENRDLAQARGERLKTQGGNMTDGQIPPDEVVFDQNKKSDEDQQQTTQVAGSSELSDAEIQALWLRKVQTKPADFLKSKFAYQRSQQEEAP